MSFSRLCSSAEPSVDKTFDVFLSFRGPDTRERFAKPLYAALDRERIWAFLDQKSLEKGDHISTGLSRAITESRICIPIFSKKFAESKWCLREVLIMVQSGVKICPVFYDVSPVDLHCQDESIYAEDLNRHENEPILEFKGALHAVSNIPGWCYSDFSGDNDLIQDIVVGIGKILHHNSPLKVLDVPVCFGLERSVDHVKGLLKAAADNRQKIVKLGIHGMSGIGKTTLAKVICKELSSGFEKFAFVLSVGERCKEADGLVNVQTQMLKDVSRFKGEVGYVDQGKGLLQEFLRHKRVLLLLDDIQTPEQLDALGGNFSQFGAGSHLIITTQNEQILKVGKVDQVYKLSGLHRQHALRLFKFHAFPNSYCSDQELATLCNDIVAACEGLPLALQIFGKLLYGKEDRNVWKEMVGKLRSEKKMQKKLRVPYDALDRHEKEMFQDIACFMTWVKNEMAMNFWAEVFPSPRACLKSLLQKSLVELGPNSELLMHQCLRDLGRSIADEMNTMPRKRTRLFNEDDVGYVLGRPLEKTKHVRYLSYEPRQPMTLNAEIFKSMYNLRLLWLTNVAIEGHFPEESSLEDLKWLRLTRYSSKRLPQGMNLHKLVILEVTNSQITHLWDETGENPTLSSVILKVLILRGCGSLQSLPGTLCHSPLQKLDLHNCHSLVSLPDAIKNWTSLVSLDMEGCSVSSLPQDFGHLINLRELNLSCCRNLSKLPPNLGNLGQLAKLEIRQNSKLTELPESIGGLKTLAFLDMEGCSVSSLPQDFGQIVNLQELNLSCCRNLSKLPPNFGNLGRLAKLEIRHNSKLTELPESIGGLKTLAFLDMEGCSVSSLPQDFGELLNLEELNLSYCQQLSELPASFGKLTQLGRLEIHHNSKLAKLPDSFGGLKILTYLDVSHCRLSDSGIAAGISELSSLVVLHLQGNGIRHLPGGFENLMQLEELHLDGCSELSVLSGLPSSLIMLFARNCTSLHTFSCLPGLPRLMTLDLSNSCHVTHFHGLQSLQQLSSVNLVGCKSISCETLVSSLSGLTALESIYFGGPGVSSAQLQRLYDSFKVCSFDKSCLMDNPDPTANWLFGEAIGKNGYENKCIDYCADESKEYCAGYIACLLSSGQMHEDCRANLPIYRLSYTIQRDESSRQCPVKHQISSIDGGDFLEVRLVRTNSSLDFPWLKRGNKLRVNAMSDCENWKASYKFLMYKTCHATANSEEDKLPKTITFMM